MSVDLQYIAYIGPGGKPTVNMDTVITKAYDCSRNDAMAALRDGMVSVNGDLVEAKVMPKAELQDKELRVGSREAVLLK